jgi:hypothetical protein
MAEQAFAQIGTAGTIANRIVIEVDGAGQPVHVAPGEDGVVGLQPFALDGFSLVADPDGAAIPGGSWNGTTFDPPPAPIEPPRTRFSPLEFMDLFTEDEQLAIVTAAMSSAPIKLWYDRMLAAEWIDTTDPRTTAGVDALVTAGLLASLRADQVLGR